VALSEFGLASSLVNGESAIAVQANGATTKVSADLLQRHLVQLDSIDTEDDLKEVCKLSDERLASLRQFRQWLIQYHCEGG
jgi:hypothetical protein